MNFFFFPVCSSGDSVGVSPEDQKKRYDGVVARKPSNILSLEHEVYGMFLFYFFFFFSSMCIFFWIYLFCFVFFFFFRNQRVNLCSFLPFFFLVLIWRNAFSDMWSFHTLSRFFKKLDTSWLQLLNVLEKVLTSALMLLPHEMYVKFFFSGICWLFVGRILGIVKYFVSHTSSSLTGLFLSGGVFFIISVLPIHTHTTHYIHTRYSVIPFSVIVVG